MKITGVPKYSIPGFLRRMQMSQEKVWVLVEGPLDRCFYDRLCRANANVTSRCFIVATPSDLADLNADGKQPLLILYRYLRAHQVLKSDLCGKCTTVLFIVDKDIDDLERIRARSPHVIYTEFYCVENYAVRFGDIAAALSAAAFLDLSSVVKRIGIDGLVWGQKVAVAWRPWVEYCLLVRRLKITNAPNYSVHTSLMHSGPYDPLDIAKQLSLLEAARKGTGLTPRKFDGIVARVCESVDRLYAAGKHDLIFKGKWYGCFLVKEAEIMRL